MRKFIVITIVGFMSWVFASLFMLIVKVLGSPHWLIATVFVVAQSHILYYCFDQIDVERLKFKKKQALTKKIYWIKFIEIMLVYFLSLVFALLFITPLLLVSKNWLFGIVSVIIFSQAYYSFFKTITT